MKAPLACLLAAFLVPAWAAADIASPDAKDAIGRVDKMPTTSGFSAQFWLTTDQDVFTAWTREGAIRSLKPVARVKRNVQVYLALFLANPGGYPIPGKTDQLYTNVTYDTYMLNPKGEIVLSNKGRVAWRGGPPLPGLITLAQGKDTFNFESIDPSGSYTIIAIVSDNIRRVNLRLVRQLELQD